MATSYVLVPCASAPCPSAYVSSSPGSAGAGGTCYRLRSVFVCRRVGKPFPARGLGQHGASRVTAFFKFGNRGLDAEGAGIYASQGRDDFDRDDVEQYFNYMGMLATEGTYDKMDALLNQGIHPVDILLLLAASEGDKPKIEELLRAGANCTVTDQEGNTAIDRASSDEIRQFIVSGPKAVV